MRKTVVVTGEKTGIAYLAPRISRLDAHVVPLPTIRLEAKKLSTRSRVAIESASQYDYILFTSSHAVEFFRNAFGTKWHPKSIKASVIAVGVATALTCKEKGLRPRVLSKNAGALEMARAMKVKARDRVLFPRSAIASNASMRLLRARGAHVSIVPLYTNKPAKIPASIQNTKPDFIVFMSASSVRSFSKQVRGMLGVPAVVIGTQTANACKKVGFQKIIIAKEATSTGIVNILRKQL